MRKLTQNPIDTNLEKSPKRVKINVLTSRNIRLLRLIGVEDGNETCFCPMDTNPEIKIKLQARVFIKAQYEHVFPKKIIDGAMETRSRYLTLPFETDGVV